jgi:DNA-binding MarR family transcriptional regulator
MPQSQPDFMFYLHDVAHLLRIMVDKRARMHDMTRAQWLILLRLHRQPGMSQKELAELLEVEPITVARLVDRLEQRRMVERRADPHDRRIWRLHLLPDAAPLIGEIEAERDEIAHLVRQGIAPETIAVVLEALQKMKATLCGELRCQRRPEPVRLLAEEEDTEEVA